MIPDMIQRQQDEEERQEEAYNAALADYYDCPHVGLYVDGGNRWHWTMQRHGFGSRKCSTELFRTREAAIECAEVIARCAGLPLYV